MGPNPAPYLKLLACTIDKANILRVDHLKNMYPNEPNVDHVTQNVEDRKFRTLACVRNEDGTWNRDLIQGPWVQSTGEASKKELLFMINQAACRAQNALPPVRGEFENSLQVAWVKTQDNVRAAEVAGAAEASKQDST